MVIAVLGVLLSGVVPERLLPREIGTSPIGEGQGTYTESVSDAMQDLAAKLAGAPAFRAAIAKQP